MKTKKDESFLLIKTALKTFMLSHLKERERERKESTVNEGGAPQNQKQQAYSGQAMFISEVSTTDSDRHRQTVRRQADKHTTPHPSPPNKKEE